MTTNNERRLIRTVNIPIKMNEGNNKGEYELDVIKVHIECGGEIIEASMDTIVTSEDVIIEVSKQAKEFLMEKQKNIKELCMGKDDIIINLLTYLSAVLSEKLKGDIEI